MTTVPDYYRILQVPTEADQATIQKSFRALLRRHHPDRNPGDRRASDTTKVLIEAYKVLSDPQRRFAYNRMRNEQRRAERLRKQQEAAPREEQESERSHRNRKRKTTDVPPLHPSSNADTEASGVTLDFLAQRMRAWDLMPQFI